MNEAIKSLYGNVSLLRAYCSKCKTYSIILYGKYQCCDEKIEKIKCKKTIRMSPANDKRQNSSVSKKESMLKIQRYKCIYCNCDLRKEDIAIHYDHFRPWSFTRNSRISNIVACCSKCNNIKSDKYFNTMHEARTYILKKRHLVKQHDDNN